jgi:hypothetical protein
MEVVVGPVSARSMGVFAGFARTTLEGAGPGADVPSDAASSFFGFIEEWEELATRGGELTWSAEAEPEVVEYLLYAFWRLAKEIGEGAGGAPIIPEEGTSFYWLLVSGLLGAMTEAGGSHAEFAANLREFWPGDQEIP